MQAPQLDAKILREYDSKKYYSTIDNFKNTLEQFGVAIIPNVLNEVKIQKMREGMWDFLETVTQSFDKPIIRDQVDTWNEFYKLLPLHSMLVQHWEIGHMQISWDLRQDPDIVNIFAKLWNVKSEDLLVSFDGAAIHFPPEVTNKGHYKNNTWLHTDQKLSDSTFQCVQSWINAYDCSFGDSTLTFLEGSHKFHGEFAQVFKSTIKEKDFKKDWHKLTEKEQEWLVNKGCEQHSITCPAGSLVLWDSRTFHSGKESLKERPEANFRFVIYLCYTPRSLCTKALLKKKQKAFNEKRTTSHWPHRPKLFQKPRLYPGMVMPNVTPLPNPILTPLGLKLAGF